MNNNKGAALIVSLVIMMLLSVLALSAIRTTNTDMQISSNFRCLQEAFYAADAGINRGVFILENGATNTWDDELTATVNDTTEADYWADSTALSGTSTYTITVSDSNGSAVIDEDGIILLTSVSSACKNSTKQIDLLVKNNSSNISQKHYKEDNMGNAVTERGSVANATRATF